MIMFVNYPVKSTSAYYIAENDMSEQHVQSPRCEPHSFFLLYFLHSFYNQEAGAKYLTPLSIDFTLSS